MTPLRNTPSHCAWRSAALVFGLFAFAFALPAQAQVLLEENFTFTGALTNNGWIVAANANSNALTASGPALTYPNLPSSGLGNGVSLVNGGEDDYKLLASTNTSGDIYTSFLVNVNLARTGDYFYAFYSTATAGGGYFGRVHVRSNSTGFNFGIGKTTAVAGTSPTYETNVRSLNTTYLVVAKMSRNLVGTNDDVVSLWVNPALGASEVPPDITNAIGLDSTNFINAVALRQGSSTAAPTLRVGSILVGTTWSSVTPTAAAGGPSITSFNPTTGPAGTAVTIAGSNFTGATNVTFNSVPASSFTVDSAAQITATVPAGATTGPIGVNTPQGFGASADNFVVPSATVTLPAQINEGTAATGTVTLTSAAPAGGVVVSLVSSSPVDLVVPASVAVAQGFTSADFQIEAPLDGTIDADVVVTVTPTATGYVGVAGSITVKNVDISTAPLTTGGYAESFAGFTSAATMPLGWTLVAANQTYSAWETATTGAKYSSATVNVFGYKHSGSTGVVQQVLTLRNETGSVISNLTVSYSGRAFTNSGDARDPGYTVSVDGQTASALAYSTGDGDNVQRSASLSGLNIAANQVFQIIWSSDGNNAPGSNTRKAIGISGVSVSATASLLPPTVGSLNIPAVSIAQTSVAVNANVSADGGSALTARGFVYAPTSLNADPSIGGTGVINVVDPLAELGAMSATLSGLTADTQYSIKAYAANAQGTSYTAVQTFTTLSPPASFTGNYSYAFDNFTGIGSLPGEWTALSSGGVQAYVGLWTSTSTSPGFYGGVSGPGVIGYTHTASTGTLTVTLRLINNTGAALSELSVSYLGRAEALTGTRFPEWTVTVAGTAVPSLAYSTASGVDETKSATVTGLSIPNGGTFDITWVSDRGLVTGNSRRIGLANVVIGTSGPVTPSITASPSSLSGLTATQGNPGPSANFTATASNLTSNITVTATDSNNFAISTNDVDFTNTLTLTTNSMGGLSSSPVYVRLTGAAQGAQSNTVTLTSGSASTNVAVSGTVTGTGLASIGLNPTSATNLVAFINSSGTAQQITVAATNLPGAVNFAADSNEYEVAAQGGNFGVVASLPASGGVALVRIKSGSAVGAVGPAVLVFESGTGLSKVTNSIPLNGTRISGGTGGLAPGLQTFANGLNYTATARFVWVLKSDTVSSRGTEFSGVNVVGNLGVSAGASFDVVLNGAGSSTDFSTDFWKSARSWLVFDVTGNTTGGFALGAITPDSGGKYYASYGSFGLRTDAGGDVYLEWTPAGVAVPSILVSTPSLSLPSTTTNVPGASANFTASGANLTNNITVTAADAADFAVSTNSTNGFVGSLVLTSTTGTVAPTPVYVRLTGATNGNFNSSVNLVSGTTSNSVTVSGAVIVPGSPTLSPTNNTALSGFTTVRGTNSTNQTFTLSGSNLSNNVVITPPAGWQVSATNANSFAASAVTIATNPAGVVSNTLIYVRLAGTNASAISYTNSILPLAVAGSLTNNILLSGSVTDPVPVLLPTNNTALSGFTTVRGTNSTNQTFTLSGSNLSNNVVITPPAGWQISATNTNSFAASAVTIATNPAGVVSNTLIYVRLAGTNASAINYTNSILPLAVAGSLTNNVLLSGSVTDPVPTLSPTNNTALSGFTTVRGTNSTSQTFTLSGSNLAAPVTLTPPPGWQISATNTNSFAASPVTIATNPAGVVSNTAIHVRLAGTNTSAISYTNSNLELAVPGSLTNIVLLSGSVTDPVPVIMRNPTNLSGFTTVRGTPSTNQSFTLSGSNLSTNITVGPLEGWQVSLTTNTNDFTSLPLVVTNNPAGFLSNTLVYVRLAGTNTNAATYTNAPLPLVSGAASNNILLSGAVANLPPVVTVSTNILPLFSAFTNQVSPVQSFTAGGSNLTTNVTVTSPTNFNIAFSSNSADFTTNVLILTNSGGVATNRDIFVRMRAISTQTNIAPTNIWLNTTGASNFVTISGSVTVAPPVLTALPALLTNFFTITGAASEAQPYVLAGSNLSTVTVSAPSGFQVALTNTNSAFTDTLSITNNGSISNNIWVRVSASAQTNTNLTGSITNTSGTVTTNVSLRAAVAPVPFLGAAPTNLTGFSTITGIASTNQSFNLSATNLLGPISLSVTNGYEISLRTNSGFATNLTLALTSASDIASNYTSATWTNGANGGTGFGPWALPGANGGTGFNGAFIGPATSALSNYLPLYTGGVAFSIYAGGADSAYQDADRILSRPLAVGETLAHSFGISFDNGNKGFDLYNGTNQVFNFNVNGSGYSWTGGNTSAPTPFPGVREFGVIINFAFTRTTNGFSYAISSPQDTNLTRSGSLTNGGIDRLKYYISGAGGGDPGNIYFNNFQVAFANSNISNLPVYVRVGTNAPIAEATNSLVSRVTISSTNATSAGVDLFGRVEDRPSISVSTNALANMSATNGYPGTSTNFLVSGRSLTNDIVLSAVPTNYYQISTDNLVFTNTLTLVRSNGIVSSNTIHVRIAPSAPVSADPNSLLGNIALSSPDAVTNVALSGRVFEDISIPVIEASTNSLGGLGSVEGSAGASTNLFVSGRNLRGNIIVRATNPVLVVSTNNLDFGSVVDLVRDTGNAVVSSPVYVRISEFAPVTANTNVFLGNLVLSTMTNSNNQPLPTNVAVFGTVTNWSIANPYDIRVTNPVDFVSTGVTNFTFRGQIGTAIDRNTLSWFNLLNSQSNNFAGSTDSTWSVSAPLGVGFNTFVFSGQFLTNAGTTNIASDAPGDGAYAPPGGWMTGDNGGYGFGPWQLYSEDGFSALYKTDIWSSTNMNVSAFNGFALESIVGAIANAYRPFVAPLQAPGGSFAVYFDSNDLQPQGSVGLQLVSSDKTPLFTFAAANNGSGPAYRISDKTNAAVDPGWAYKQDGLFLRFEMTSSNTYSLTASGSTFTNTNKGTIISKAAVAGVIFFTEGAGPAPGCNFYIGQMMQNSTLYNYQSVSTVAPDVERTAAPPATAYDLWAQGYGLNPAGNGAPTADPDNDGFANDMEFAFGTNPIVANGALLEVTHNGGSMVVTFLARVADVSYSVMQKANLAASVPAWADTGITPTVTPDQTGVPANYQRRSFSVAASGQNFYRVRATFGQ